MAFKLSITVLLISISILVSSCITNQCDDADIDLRLAIRYEPANVDTFNIGDTLFINSIFSDSISDKDGNNIYKIENFDFYTSIVFNRIEDDDYASLIIDSTQIIDINVDYTFGNSGLGGTTISIQSHNYQDNIYSFDLKIKLNEPGLYYLINISRLGRTGTSPQSFEEQCSGQEVGGLYVVNNGNAIENNLDMLQESFSVFEGSSGNSYNRDGSYTFYVRE